jgi:TolB-like protein
MLRRHLSLLILPVALSATLLATQNPPAQPPASPPAQQSEVQLVISSGTGAPPHYAVPDFLALSGDNETKAAAATIAQVLWDDLDFEREFYMIPRDTYGAIPAARSVTDVPFDRWRELGADGLLIGTVQKEGSGLKIQVRLFNVASRQAVFSREYTGSSGNPRAYAHTTADEIHQQQRALRGIARTKLTFSSDRDREKITNTVENRDVKEIYIADYDGANQRRITVNRALNITPTWAPDGRSIAYTSYARGFPTLFISFIAGRDEDRLHVEPRWQPRTVRDESGRRRHAPAHEPSEHRHHADLVAHRRPGRLHGGPLGVSRHLPGRQRRAEPAPRLTSGGRLLRQADMVAGALQRTGVRLPHRTGLRYQDL